uniref:Uncharacterized protein n=1 Tax=Wolbachia endosymbiont of Aleurodicus dispersus TaxID=1288877 RepID=A0A3B0JDQ4_9RICK
MPADVEAVKVEIKRQTNTVNQATETDTQLCEDINKSSEDLNIPQPTCETSEKIQDAPTETSNVPNDFPSMK